MIKIGDKVKFDEYLPHNYMNGAQLIYSLVGHEKLRLFRTYSVERKEKTLKYKSILIQDKQDNKYLEGIYVGPFYKKLIRSYRRLDTPIENPFEERILAVRTSVIGIPEIQRIDRYSVNPRRIDNPRVLDKMAMIKIGRKLIGVPMVNIMRCNFDNTLRVL